MTTDYQVRRIAFTPGDVATTSNTYPDLTTGWTGYFTHTEEARRTAAENSGVIGVGLYRGDDLLEHSWFAPTSEGRATPGAGEWATTGKDPEL